MRKGAAAKKPRKLQGLVRTGLREGGRSIPFLPSIFDAIIKENVQWITSIDVI